MMTEAEERVRALAKWAAMVDFAIREFKRKYVEKEEVEE